MNTLENLKGKTLFITGGSRGIGREIALKCAKDGANIVLAAKSSTPHPKLPGTIHSVAEEGIKAGGQALAIQLDVRDDEAVIAAMAQAAETFGGIDGLINNAGAIKLAPVERLPLKRFDLMHQINTRAVLSASQAALPYLKKSDHAHIVNLSPPINLDPKWFANYGPYTVTKYGMSMLTISMAAEFKRFGIAVNSLWPKTIIATAAVEFEAGNPKILECARTPAIMADAAYQLLLTSNSEINGQHLIDESLLKDRGVEDFECYRHDPDSAKALINDLYVE